MTASVRDQRIDVAQTVYSPDCESYSGRRATSVTSDTWLDVVAPLFDALDAVRLTVWWRRGNPEIMELARRRGAS